MNSSLISKTFFIGLLFLIIIPMMLLVYNSCFANANNLEHFVQYLLPEYLYNSVYLLIFVGLLTAIIGVACAWLVVFCDFPFRRVLILALALPLAIPSYVQAIIWSDLLDIAGPVQQYLINHFDFTSDQLEFLNPRSLLGAVCIFTISLYPYVYIILRSNFALQPVNLLETAQLLGKSPWHKFIGVTMPLARPALVAALALVSMELLADYGTVKLLAIDSFTTGIYRAWLGLEDLGSASKLSLYLIAIICLCLFAEKYATRKNKYYHNYSLLRPIAKYQLQGYYKYAAILICSLPPLIGFVIPMLWLIFTSLGLDISHWQNSRNFGALYNSLIMAISSSLLIILITIALCYFVRRQTIKRYNSFWWQSAARVATIGYAIPGTIIAIAISSLLIIIDRFFISLGLTNSLLLSSSLFALFYAFLVRFLAVSYGVIEAGFGKISPELDDNAKLLGHGNISIITKIHIPLLAIPLLSAMIMLVIDIIKELPASLIVRPFDFNSLAITAFELAGDERYEEAALPSLMLVIIATIAVVILNNSDEKIKKL